MVLTIRLKSVCQFFKSVCQLGNCYSLQSWSHTNISIVVFKCLWSETAGKWWCDVLFCFKKCHNLHLKGNFLHYCGSFITTTPKFKSMKLSFKCKIRHSGVTLRHGLIVANELRNASMLFPWLKHQHFSQSLPSISGSSPRPQQSISLHLTKCH